MGARKILRTPTVSRVDWLALKKEYKRLRRKYRALQIAVAEANRNDIIEDMDCKIIFRFGTYRIIKIGESNA